MHKQQVVEPGVESELGSAEPWRRSGVQLSGGAPHDDDETFLARFAHLLRGDAEFLHEVVDRFDQGDFTGALAASQDLLDRNLVPRLLVPRQMLDELALDRSTSTLLMAIDDESTLEAVIEASTLPMVEALSLLAPLVEDRIVELRGTERASYA
jgi:hypothetical protein